MNIDWTDCSWELRLVTYASNNIATPAVGHTVLDHDLKEVEDEDVSQKMDSYPVGSAVRRLSSSSSVAQHVITSSIVCGRWKEPPFSCAQWHSIALTLRSNTGSPLYSSSLFGTSMDSSSSGFLSAASSSSLDSITANVVTLVVDGVVRTRAALEATRKFEMPSSATPPGSTAQLLSHSASLPSTSLLSKLPSNAQSQSQLQYQAEFQEGTLLAWLPEKSLDSPPHSLSPAVENEPIAPANSDFQLIFRVGGDYFMGFVKAVAVCAE